MKKRSFRHAFHWQKSGQISILLALIFPVLFVFFAMTVNIGLVVHDKINLQTSADLAAYYAAQKQAEILNTIAHLNYQIRQHWKLLSFRIRGFGSAGLGSDPAGSPQALHPFRSPNPPIDIDWDEKPTVCTQFARFWREKFFLGGDYVDITINECKTQNPTIEGFLPPVALAFNAGFNEVVRSQSLRRVDDIARACRLHGTTNWIVATMWLEAFIKALYHRKKAIKELAENLRDGLDLRGDLIEAGARETFINNLTRSNREAFERDGEFELFNSMNGIEWNRWLVERPLYTVVYYTDSEWVPSGNTGICERGPRPHFTPNLPVHIDDIDIYQTPEMQTLIQRLEFHTQQEINAQVEPDQPDLNLDTIIGYEKNPWYMVYYGIRVQTSPIQPFSPFVGDNVLTMSARAFAKPFGGKIGPWMFDSWPQGRDVSDSSVRIDDTLPPVRDENGDFSLPDPLPVGLASPNYARYPGDDLGLRSFAALRIYQDSLTPSALSHFDFFDRDRFLPPPSVESKYDPLAWRDGAANPFIDARIVEVMAISPDLFDLTYYSIDPRFYKNHDDMSDPGLLFRTTTLDLGGSSDLPRYDPNIFGVFDQWAWANDLGQGTPPDIGSSYRPVGSLPNAPWFVKDWKHLLTGWVPNVQQQFGKCDNKGDLTVGGREEESLPGSCAIGGRMGYSVKLVSRRYLTSDLPLGGVGGGSGKIRNGLTPPFLE